MSDTLGDKPHPWDSVFIRGILGSKLCKCSRLAGWVVFRPSSTHVPRVDGGRMLILYFLPGGANQFAA